MLCLILALMVAVGCSSTGADKAAVSSANTKATVSKQAKVKNKTPPVMSEMSGHLQKWSSKNSSP